VDKNAIAKMEAIIALYPKIGLRELTAIISDTIPIAGKINNIHLRVAQKPEQMLVQHR